MKGLIAVYLFDCLSNTGLGTRVQCPALWKAAITRCMRASYLLIAVNEEGVFSRLSSAMFCKGGENARIAASLWIAHTGPHLEIGILDLHPIN